MDGAQCTASGANWCKLVPWRAKLVVLSCVWAPGAPCGSASVSLSVWLFLSEVWFRRDIPGEVQHNFYSSGE